MKAAGLFALRLVLGGIFIYAGLAKLVWFHDMTTAGFATMGLPGSASAWAYFVGGLELLGGVMVLLGVYARYAALWLSLVMVVAVWSMRANPMGLAGLFSPLAVLGGCLAILGGGAGKWRLVATECHCKECKMNGAGGCGGACADKHGSESMPAEEGGCCGGGCGRNCSEEKK